MSVAVIPRERFGIALRSLESILAHTSFPHELIYVDGGSPRAVRRRLHQQAQARRFRLIREDRYLTPNQARNLALRHVDTEYVVFIDNDAMVQPGWLGALVACADETGAAICTPLCLFRDEPSPVVHVARVRSAIEERDGVRSYKEERHHAGRTVEDVRTQLRREETDLAEFHCMLVRTRVLADLGPLDERLLNVNEHVDLCLAVRQAGGRIFFTPESVVTLVGPPPLAWSDVPYFALRWSEEWTDASLAHFARKWRLPLDDPGLEATRRFSRWHRRRVLDPPRRVYHALRRAVGSRPGGR